MRLRLTPRAVADLGEIADYLLERNPAAAAKVRDAILDALNILTLFPEAGRRQSVDGVRKLVTRKYRYLVYYLIDSENDELVVVAIRHAARRRSYADI